ncbi:hypothetical protein [Dactylosporangium sp. CA-139066]|uniref:hypothetical protein n=1 Tax=Dactylosporangium sp. CA-139066 TaxID=3239930 RepID=UPI003D89CEBA
MRNALLFREDWTDEQVEALVGHPSEDVRRLLAEAPFLGPEQRARLVEDPASSVLAALAFGPEWFWWPLRPGMPRWAYERLLERAPGLRVCMWDNGWAPEDLRGRSTPEEEPADEEPVGDVSEAVALADDEHEGNRAHAATDPRLPAEIVARLAVDPSELVRMVVAMRRELTEEQRAAIDYRVEPWDRIAPARWAARTRDREEQRRCVYSAHIGLRRSVAGNPHLAPDLVAVLAGDADFAVRLLLCEGQRDVPGDTVLETYLEARTMITRGRLLDHPSFRRAGLARLADAPEAQARALARLDPDAPPELIERLSRDPVAGVRKTAAADPRLSLERVLELFDDPSTTGGAAANPRLPVELMRRIVDDA